MIFIINIHDVHLGCYKKRKERNKERDQRELELERIGTKIPFPHMS